MRISFHLSYIPASLLFFPPSNCLYSLLSLFFYPNSIWFFIHGYLETLQHLDHIASRVFGCVLEGAVYFYCCVINVSFVKFTGFNFMIYEFDE